MRIDERIRRSLLLSMNLLAIAIILVRALLARAFSCLLKAIREFLQCTPLVAHLDQSFAVSPSLPALRTLSTAMCRIFLRPKIGFWRLQANLNLFRAGAGHAFRKSTAGAFGPDLAKKLSQLVKMEKNVMRSMELVGRERMEVAVGNLRAEKIQSNKAHPVTATTVNLGRSMRRRCFGCNR